MRLFRIKHSALGWMTVLLLSQRKVVLSFTPSHRLPSSSASSAWRSTTTAITPLVSLSSSSSSDNNNNDINNDDSEEEPPESRRQKIRRRVRKLAQNIVTKPIQLAAPDAVLAVITDATAQAVDLAVDDLVQRRSGGNNTKRKGAAAAAGEEETRTAPSPAVLDTEALVDDTFKEIEESLVEMEVALQTARAALVKAKVQARETLERSMAQSMAQALESAVEAVEKAEQDASRKVLADIYASTVDSSVSSTLDIASLAFEDVDYGTSEMAPPFLGEDQCLVPGEPVVRVEKAPENSRRIFAGIDIPCSVDVVWKLLTDYEHLQDVVPNLVVNDVLEEYPPAADVVVDASLPEDEQCRAMADQMKGSLLRQVGGAKVAGIRFSARTTLEVREWPQGLPDFAHFRDQFWDGKSRKERAKESSKVPLQRYKFPRPFAVSSLPTRDISMQSVVDDDGEFRMYQGVWRMQPLPGCAPEGNDAMRLTYAVEVSPRAYLPVQLVEGRIVRDLCTNLEAIRDHVTAMETA